MNQRRSAENNIGFRRLAAQLISFVSQPFPVKDRGRTSHVATGQSPPPPSLGIRFLLATPSRNPTHPLASGCVFCVVVTPTNSHKSLIMSHAILYPLIPTAVSHRLDLSGDDNNLQLASISGYCHRLSIPSRAAGVRSIQIAVTAAAALVHAAITPFSRHSRATSQHLPGLGRNCCWLGLGRKVFPHLGPGKIVLGPHKSLKAELEA